jgi:hypothetical protein
MPSNFIKDIVKQTGVKEEKIEHTFKKVEESAKKSGATNPYAVATAAVERMSGYKPHSK